MPKLIGDPKVLFNLFDWECEDDTYIVTFYHYRKGKRLKYFTGRKIRPNDWDRKKQRARHTKHFAASSEVNSRLEEISRCCIEINSESGATISPKDFRKQLESRLNDNDPKTPEPEPITFLEFVELSYKERAKQATSKSGTLEVLHKVWWHLQTYAKERRRKLEFSELNERMYNDFRSWLFSPPRSLSINYVHRIFQYLKYFIRKAENQHLHNDRSYREFKTTTAPVTKIVLTFEQLEHLATLDFSQKPHLEKARDLFLIGSYSGMRYSDFSRISPEHIKTHKGERVLEITTKKTAQTVIIPLHPILDSILSRYGYTSPKMHNQDMNGYLKEIGQAAGLTHEIIVQDSKGGIRKERRAQFWEMLTTHVARRSFATNYYERHPEQIDRIMKITGHTTERMFRAYIVTDARDSALKFAAAIQSK